MEEAGRSCERSWGGQELGGCGPDSLTVFTIRKCLIMDYDNIATYL